MDRVPSQSNPSDVLSREVVSNFEGAERVRVNPWEIWKSLDKWSSCGGHPRAQNGGESAAVGMSIAANSPFSKRKECACLQGFTVHGHLHTSYMAASVGPKAQSELFHEHDRLLFAWGRSGFLCLHKQLPSCVKVCHVPFLAPACQVTHLHKWHALSLNNAQVSLHPLDVVTCFLLVGGLVFLFPPTRSLSSPSLLTQVCHWTSVRGQVSPKNPSLILFCWNYSSSHTSLSTRLSHNVSLPNPQPESAAVGMSITANSPFSERKECACLQGFTVHGHLHTSYMAASVGPKAQ